MRTGPGSSFFTAVSPPPPSRIHNNIHTQSICLELKKKKYVLNWVNKHKQKEWRCIVWLLPAKATVTDNSQVLLAYNNKGLRLVRILCSLWASSGWVLMSSVFQDPSRRKTLRWGRPFFWERGPEGPGGNPSDRGLTESALHCRLRCVGQSQPVAKSDSGFRE